MYSVEQKARGTRFAPTTASPARVSQRGPKINKEMEKEKEREKKEKRMGQCRIVEWNEKIRHGREEEGREENGETRRGEARLVDGLTYVRAWTA